MKRPETSLTEEPGTLPLGGSDPTEALPGAPGPRLVLGRYRLERRLGAGGFGVVWLAWDEKLEREVAVKTIPLENGSGQRVEREARAAARLNHPGIVGIYELASDEHDVYLVSELVRGRTLGELLRVGALADRDVARIGMAVCDALEHAHARGVIHRDVKPGNVMVLAEPAAGAGFAKLADFGVAHVVSHDPLTRTGDVVGTLAYMAPEQAEGAAVTPACDVYSLALTLFEAWTGTNPVRAGGPAATARRLGRPLPSLRAPAPRPATRPVRRDRRRPRGRPGAPPRPAATASRARRRRCPSSTTRAAWWSRRPCGEWAWPRPSGAAASGARPARLGGRRVRDCRGRLRGRPARGSDRLRRRSRPSAPSRRSRAAAAAGIAALAVMLLPRIAWIARAPARSAPGSSRPTRTARAPR